MKKTSDKLVQDLINNIGHPLFFEGYDAVMRNEKQFLLNEVKADTKKLKRKTIQRIQILFGCIFSFVFAILWLLFVPAFSLIKILKKMFLIPFKVKEHQKLVSLIKNHKDYPEIEKHLKNNR
jgi:uncharacterized membrane protein YagU involved in acid resistance